ncbi:GNAT family N-acetyltransferase [Massilia oculi]|uniref:GNAT family N-acetyltransferase n=1 Tax=Massilia hydrophila TaxID=3044279 RepID=A0ABS7YDJ3_9BURK|nr:GNAT family N-acetyltransferase [Massilia oculi]MCA1857062.1 GNAT family N-acetyltransferase [Massilia oculi]
MNGAFTTSVPILHTDRLILREYRREDFDAFAAHCADPVSAAYIGVVERQAAWRIFCSQAGMWLLDGAGWWSVEERESGRLVGSVGAFFREESKVMELGWNTYRACWGQGFAHEAAAALLHHAFEVRRESTVRALIDPGNASSLRVAGRLGLTYEADVALYGKAVGMYTRERGAALV